MDEISDEISGEIVCMLVCAKNLTGELCSSLIVGEGDFDSSGDSLDGIGSAFSSGPCNTQKISLLIDYLHDDIDSSVEGGIEQFCDQKCGGLGHSTEFLLTHFLPQLLLALLGIIMNISSIVYMKKRKWKRKAFPSEYQLISLCVSDLMFCFLVCILMAFSIISEKTEFLHKFYFLSEISESVLQSSILASIFHVLAISFERLFAVSLPLRHRVFSCKRNAKKVIASIWVITLLVSSFLVGYRFKQGIQHRHHGNYRTSFKMAGILMYVSTFLLLVVYALLTYKLVQQAQFMIDMQSSQPQPESSKQSKQRGWKVEIATFLAALFVTTAFIVCTIPFATLRVLGISDPSPTLESVCENLLICNSILNPLIYFWRGFWLRSRRRSSCSKQNASTVKSHRSDWTELSSRKPHDSIISRHSIATIARHTLISENHTATVSSSSSEGDLVGESSVDQYQKSRSNTVLSNLYSSSVL